MSRKITTEIFIERARQVHGDKYDYSKVEYTKKDNKVCIICPEHGEFWQIANNHMRGAGCPKCGVKKVSDSKRKDTESFIKKARELYGDKYDYSKTIYKGSKELLTITCPIHGDFEIIASNHLVGCGCKKCSNALKGQYKKLDTEQFIEKANKIHNNFYDYSKTKYVLSNKKVIITCPIHGDFEQTPNHHLGGEGCPVCKQSKGERLVENILLKYHVPFKREVTFHVDEIVKNRKEFRIDFVVEFENKMYFIEYNGKQHYQPVNCFGGLKALELQQKRDSYVRGFAYRNQDKISLLELNYRLRPETVENKIKEYLAPIIEYYNRKQGELLESCDANQQPSQLLTKLEGSETNS